MPRKALRLRVELCINAVSCPGVYLPHRDDVYLSVYLLGQHRRTQLTSPVFPLLFRERFKFDKVFFTAYEPSHVQDAVEHDIVLFELIQPSSSHGGRLLASYEANAKDFLYPYPSYSPTYSATEREVLLERAMHFPGIAPKVQFSTKTVIEETKKPVLTSVEAALLENMEDDHYRRDNLLRRRSARSRTRSLSPATYRQLEALSLEDYDAPYYDDGPREPFVVRKVDPNLIGRKPGTDYHRRRARKKRAMSPTSRSLALVPVTPRTPRDGYGAYLEDYEYTRPNRRLKAVREPTDYILDDLSDLSDDLGDLDIEVAGLTSNYMPRPPTAPAYHRSRPKSPILYRSSLRERYDEPSYVTSPRKYGYLSTSMNSRLNRSAEKLDRIGERLYSSKLDRSGDRLYSSKLDRSGDRLYSSYHSSYDPVLADLDYELQQARHRRYYDY